jgi:hypothetical protein
MHDPSTTGVHGVDGDNLENDPIAADHEVPYAEYLDEPGDDDPGEDPDGDNVEDPNPDEEPYARFDDFDDPFNNDLDPFKGEVIDLKPDIKVETVSEEALSYLEAHKGRLICIEYHQQSSLSYRKRPPWLPPQITFFSCASGFFSVFD